MLVGQRLKEIRESKNLSQSDIASATGFARPYISRIENGHTVPSIETLEKWAHAFAMPLYQLLYEGEAPPKPLKLSSKRDEKLWGDSRGEASQLNRLRLSLANLSDRDRKILLALAGRMVSRSKVK